MVSLWGLFAPRQVSGDDLYYDPDAALAASALFSPREPTLEQSARTQALPPDVPPPNNNVMRWQQDGTWDAIRQDPIAVAGARGLTNSDGTMLLHLSPTMGEGNRGEFRPFGGVTINSSLPPEDFRETLMHELGHSGAFWLRNYLREQNVPYPPVDEEYRQRIADLDFRREKPFGPGWRADLEGSAGMRPVYGLSNQGDDGVSETKRVMEARRSSALALNDLMRGVAPELLKKAGNRF